jgi:RimJ/RimL family protein N-acetyltransferase
MNISATTDIDFITRCILANYDWLTDDGDTCPGLYFPPFGDNITWVKVEEYGVFLLEQKNFVMFECHTALLPTARGKAVDIGKQALKWAFENTPALRIITAVPETNQLALRMALKSGFIQYGINTGSFCKHGKLYSQFLLGINKGD